MPVRWGVERRATRAAVALLLATALAPAAASGDGAAATTPPAHPCAQWGVASAAPADARGEFEGVYRVGRTRCTVAPARMSYALRWQRGHRPMDFFYEGESAAGEAVFVSEPRAEGVDRFYFADRGLDRGVFVRADGLCLPVQRLGAAPRR